MPLRSFFAFDSDGLTVSGTSPHMTPGSSIINNSDTPDGTIFDYSAGLGTIIELDDDDNGHKSHIFNDDDEDDHVITDGGGIVADGTEVESESKICLKALDDNGNPTGPVITIHVFSKDGDTSDIWGFGTTAPLVDGTSYVKVGGDNDGSSLYSDFIPCFGPGTMLRAPGGEVAVEMLEPGMRVWTADDPACAVQWVGRTSVAATGRMAPVHIAAGALGNARALDVSQEHRMVLRGAQVELLFSTPKVLVAAKFLAGLPGVEIRPGGEITYTHLLFDRHRIVMSNGCESESFFPASTALGALDQGPLHELLTLFPALSRRPASYGKAAARILTAPEAALAREALRSRGARIRSAA